MDLIFNFIGMCVADWPRAYTFFTQTLGMQAELNPVYGDWANLGAAWSGYYSETHSLVCELFDQGRKVDERRWGKNQNIRPAIHVPNLESAQELFYRRGVNFTGQIEHRPWGKQVEFETTEGIRWALAEVPGKPVRQELSQPQFGHIAIKARDFDAQKLFYNGIMGLSLEGAENDWAVLIQNRVDHPFIILEAGGETIQPTAIATPHPERQSPFFLSFMTADIQDAAAKLIEQDIPTLRSLARHDDWGGTDLVITDTDGNAIQIVQYE